MGYYEEHAKEYIDRTFNLDVSPIYDMFLKDVKKGGSILDIGCGSGRDSLYFQNNGYDVYAIDPVKEFCEHAKEIGVKNIECASIQNYKTKIKFDAIWASASLLHLDNNDLLLALKKIFRMLKKGGVVYASFKFGNSEVFKDGRFYNNMNKTKFINIISNTKFLIGSFDKGQDILHRYNSWVEIKLFKK